MVNNSKISNTIRRNTSSKSKDPKNAPEINFDHRKGNSILHQKAARASELNAELNALLDSQAKRRADEMNRPFGASFLDFVRNSKSQIINIFATFTCVLLAWQIVNIRKGARKLIESAEETNEKMEEYKLILRMLSSEEFTTKVSKMHEKEMKKREGQGSGKSSWLGRSDPKSIEKESDSLSAILRSELVKVIGNRALNNTEIEELKLVELQKEMGIVRAKKEKASSVKSATSDSSLAELEQLFIEVQKDGDSDRTVIKRSKGFI